VADNILVTKARKRIAARDSTLGERIVAAVVWAAMKIKTKIGMGLKTKKKKKANTSGNETRWYPTNPTVVGDSRFIGRRSGENRGE